MRSRQHRKARSRYRPRGIDVGFLLDLGPKVRFTDAMFDYDTHVMCQLIDALDMEKRIKQMARQRRVGARGNSTG